VTQEQFAKMVESIDPINAQYIMADADILQEFDGMNRWECKDPMCLSVMSKGENADEHCARVAASVRDSLKRKIREFDSWHLTPANAKVGDGATVNLWSDRHAGTIVKVTKATITIRQDKAIKDPDFKPEWVTGGFSAVCLNSEDQAWSYEPDENGRLYTIHWSRKGNRYGTYGNLTASKGRHEHYDYNF
jgi:hypothetical protein